MVKKRRWLLAAAVLPLILAACTSTTGRPGPGTGTAGTVAGSGSAGPGGLRAVRHVWVIELENQGYAQSFGTPSADPYLATTLPRTGALLENYYADRPQQRGQLHRAGLRAGPGHRHPDRLPALDTFPGPGHRRALPPGPRRGLRLPGGGPDARQPAVRRRAQLGRVPAGHGQRPGPGSHGRHGARARLRPPRHLGRRPHPEAPSKATSTPPATTGSRSSARSPPTRPSAPRTSCRSGRCRATWPGPPPPRRSPSSRRTCATTATTRRASPAPRAGWPRPTRSCPSGCRRSWPRRPTGTAA